MFIIAFFREIFYTVIEYVKLQLCNYVDMLPRLMVIFLV